jgi:hypothetical protein
MKDRDYTADTTPSVGGPLLAPARSQRVHGHVNKVDWSRCPLAHQYNISGETRGGPGRTWARKPGARAA